MAAISKDLGAVTAYGFAKDAGYSGTSTDFATTLANIATIATSIDTAMAKKADLVNGKVPSSELPSYVDNVIEGYYNSTDGKFYKESTYVTEIPGETGKIYVDLSANSTYRWSGSVFVKISNPITDASDLTVNTITASTSEYPEPTATETVKVITGKIKKFLDDLKTKKADKVTSATNGHLAGLDSNGNLTDSGSKASDFLTSHQTIKQDGVTGATVNRFGTCSTSAGTAAKTVSITTGTFSLEAGARVSVKFNNANTASTPTLNVNSTGAKNIYHKGSQITSGDNKALLAGTVDFIYDGTQFHLVGNYIDTTGGGGTDYTTDKTDRYLNLINPKLTYTTNNSAVNIKAVNYDTLVIDRSAYGGSKYPFTVYPKPVTVSGKTYMHQSRVWNSRGFTGYDNSGSDQIVGYWGYDDSLSNIYNWAHETGSDIRLTQYPFTESHMRIPAGTWYFYYVPYQGNSGNGGYPYVACIKDWCLTSDRSIVVNE